MGIYASHPHPAASGPALRFGPLLPLLVLLPRLHLQPIRSVGAPAPLARALQEGAIVRTYTGTCSSPQRVCSSDPSSASSPSFVFLPPPPRLPLPMLHIDLLFRAVVFVHGLSSSNMPTSSLLRHRRRSDERGDGDVGYAARLRKLV